MTTWIVPKTQTFLSLSLVETEHKELNVPDDPCEEDTEYNFSACVKRSMSSQIGCRTMWDTGNEANLTLCDNLDQFRWGIKNLSVFQNFAKREYESRYLELQYLTRKEITSYTGCKKPCHYREYRRVGEPSRLFIVEEKQKGMQLWIVGKEKASEVRICILDFAQKIFLRYWFINGPLWLLNLLALLAYLLDFPSCHSGRVSFMSGNLYLGWNQWMFNIFIFFKINNIIIL